MMNLFEINVLALLSYFIWSCSATNSVDVTDFGADITGQNKSTDAIRRAIDKVAVNGEGFVFFPKGHYKTGPIHLKSNVTLLFEDGTTVVFSPDFEDFLPFVTMRWEGTVLKNFSPLIYAYKADNIGLKGRAVLDGNGPVWWKKLRQLKDIYKNNGSRPEPYQQASLIKSILNMIFLAYSKILLRFW